MPGMKIAQTQVTALSSDLAGLLAQLAGVNTALSNRVLELEGGLQPVDVVPITAGVVTLDLAGDNTVFQISHTANITSFVFQNPPPAGKLKSWTVQITGTGTARTTAWPTSVKPNGGTAPTILSTNGKVTTLQLITWDGGATIHLFKSGET